MTRVSLEESPSPRVLGWSQADFGGVQQGPLGGAATRLNRPGNRWRLALELPSMTATQARRWAADLTRGLRLGVKLTLFQPGLDTGMPGTVLVAGAGQAGSALDLDGFTAAYAWRKGQWLTVTTGGQGYLYQASAQGVADALGLGTVELEPVLRVTPADNDAVEFAQPWIEGLLEGVPWDLTEDRLCHGLKFAIAESR